MTFELGQELLRHLCIVTKLQPITMDRAEWLVLLSLVHAVALLHQLRHKDQIIFKEGEDFIFTLNAANPGKKDKECAEAIRGCLSGDREGKRMVVKVPLRWHALYYKLVEVSEGLGTKVLSREQCGKVAESIRINEGSCEEALSFFNRLNMLFYFPDILADLVFIEPRIVLDNELWQKDLPQLLVQSVQHSRQLVDCHQVRVGGQEQQIGGRDVGVLSGQGAHAACTLLQGLLIGLGGSELVD